MSSDTHIPRIVDVMIRALLIKKTTQKRCHKLLESTDNTTSMESQGFENPVPKTVEEMANLYFGKAEPGY